jgi:hypothetical protein
LRINPAMLRQLGFGDPKVFAIPQNTLVVADTMGFTRAASRRDRLRAAKFGHMAVAIRFCPGWGWT